MDVNISLWDTQKEDNNHKETDKTVKKKVDLILFEKLKPILCIGESEIEKKKVTKNLWKNN